MDVSLPNIIWVAVSPPVPPFNGGTLKAYCGIRALASVTNVRVVSLVQPQDGADKEEQVARIWAGSNVDFQFVEYGPRSGVVQSALSRRFQLGTSIENSPIRQALRDMDALSGSNLIIFDDIVFAPFLEEFGGNAILSCHDCISEMMRSHARHAPPGIRAAKYWLQYRIARHYESAFYDKALLIHTVTERDRVWLQAINEQARYHTAPYVDLSGLSFSRTARDDFDILVWADLRIAPIAAGTRQFLEALLRSESGAGRSVMVIGRLAPADAGALLGESVMSSVEYSRFLEDENGRVRQGSVTVIPDLGGAGIKSRCLTVLSSGKCLACLYSQMEGLEAFKDQCAINAFTLEDLASAVGFALRSGRISQIAEAGYRMYNDTLSPAQITTKWVDMVRRACTVRSYADRSEAPAVERVGAHG